MLTPADALLHRARTGRSRPPLWLRRHLGVLRNFESAAREMANFLRRFRLVEPNDRVLDVGCGTGAMAFELVPMLGAEGLYTDFDVYRPAIEWCRAAFARDPRFRFEVVENSSPPTENPGDGCRVPMRDNEAGLVLAKSVFTHLLQGNVRHFLREIRRTLRPGRTAVVTAFLFARGSRTDRGASPIFPFGNQDGVVRWRWKARPESAVAYERDYFCEMIAEAGLRVGWLCQGFWRGDSAGFNGQDILLIGH